MRDQCIWRNTQGAMKCIADCNEEMLRWWCPLVQQCCQYFLVDLHWLEYVHSILASTVWCMHSQMALASGFWMVAGTSRMPLHLSTFWTHLQETSFPWLWMHQSGQGYLDNRKFLNRKSVCRAVLFWSWVASGCPVAMSMHVKALNSYSSFIIHSSVYHPRAH